MKPVQGFSHELFGFRGYLYKAHRPTDRCIIVLAGDEGNDFLSQAFARWLTRKQCVDALCLSLRQTKADEDGVHSWPLEYVEKAVERLKKQGVVHIGILGISIQAAMALSAAARIPDISLVLAFAPCDFVPWGFCQGQMGLSLHAEWPSGTSAFSWRGEDLPCQPPVLSRESYWDLYRSKKKAHGEMHSISVFEYSERHHPIEKEAFIPVENIKGRVVLIGTEDDSMWASARYIRRMEQRLRRKEFSYPLELAIYPYGTHLLVPATMLKMALPFGEAPFTRIFNSGKKFPAECAAARVDVEKRLTAAIRDW